MSVSDIVKIGSDEVDINTPCDIVKALRKVELVIMSGGRRETVRLGQEEITYSKANISGLQSLIRHYDAQCQKISGNGRTRFAKRIRHV